MASEPITFPNLNYGSAITPGNGAFTTQMLCAALGMQPSAAQIGVAVDIGALAPPDFRPSNNPNEWLWKPDTVQTYMTSAAAASIRNAVQAAYAAGRANR